MSPFDRLASVYAEVPGVTRTTMMGHPSLKVGRAIFASSRHDGDTVALRLPAERVAALIADGTGAAFTPGRTPVATWVEIEGVAWDRLVELADEAFERARDAAG